MSPTNAISPALADLAAACGVASTYSDAHGVDRVISSHTLRAVLAAMGVATAGDDDEDDTADRLALQEVRLRPWRRVLPPTIVARQGAETSSPVHVPRGATVRLSIEFEEGGAPLSLYPDVHCPDTGPRESRDVDGVLIERLTVTIPDSLPPGWHRVLAVVEGDGRRDPDTAGAAPARCAATLLVSPSSIPVPAGLDHRRAVGLATQLYQVRSDESWGVGDLADLAELAGWAGRDLDADFVLVNPMHAGEPFPPVEPSPYLPTTRRFASPLYLRPEQIPEYLELAAPDRQRVNDLAATVRAANASDTIDRNASWSAKLDALRLLFAVPRTGARAEEFAEYVSAQEPGLHRYATWCALAAEYGSDWSAWPAEYRDPQSPAVEEFADDHLAEIRFHQWLQWQVAEQRAAAQHHALESGMRIGILHDLAVGVHPTGADSWALGRSLARGVTVGAPPDVYNQLGQDWSQPPLRPDALAEQGYGPFRDIVRAALRDSGGVRIDHILGLFRLWWIPAGLPPTAGTYVHYDHDAMIGVLALEAWRAGAVVIGEDLGTVAPGVRETLSERGVLGTSVMWFERHDDRPLPPEDYRRLCMASVTTHDLPPSAGYLDLVHVDLREQLGQLSGDATEERLSAGREIASFVDAVRQRGLLEGSDPDDLVVALHAYLSAAPSLLYAVSVADLVGDRRPVNMPGTSREYPNWCVPLTDHDGGLVSLGDLRESGVACRVVAAALGRRG